jgi:hypothetical protein
MFGQSHLSVLAWPLIFCFSLLVDLAFTSGYTARNYREGYTNPSFPREGQACRLRQERYPARPWGPDPIVIALPAQLCCLCPISAEMVEGRKESLREIPPSVQWGLLK